MTPLVNPARCNFRPSRSAPCALQNSACPNACSTLRFGSSLRLIHSSNNRPSATQSAQQHARVASRPHRLSGPSVPHGRFPILKTRGAARCSPAPFCFLSTFCFPRPLSPSRRTCSKRPAARTGMQVCLWQGAMHLIRISCCEYQQFGQIQAGSSQAKRMESALPTLTPASKLTQPSSSMLPSTDARSHLLRCPCTPLPSPDVDTANQEPCTLSLGR